MRGQPPHPRPATVPSGSAWLPWLGADRLLAAHSSGNGRRECSLMDLTPPIRSNIFMHLVGDLLCYSGVDEANEQLDQIQRVCREFYDQINEECHTFSYNDHCGFGANSDRGEVRLLKRCLQRHPRLKYFECVLRSASRLQAIVEELQLPADTKCSFVFEFKVAAADLFSLLRRFRIWRLSIPPEETVSGTPNWSGVLTAPTTGIKTLCLRSCSDGLARTLIGSMPRLRGLQIIDSKLTSSPNISSAFITSLSLAGVVTMPDAQFSFVISCCPNLRSLYISKCNITNISINLSRLELLSVTYCRQLTDQCCSEMLQSSNNPRLRFVDLTENRGLTSPVIAHPLLEVAWLMHCQQLTDQSISQLFERCPSLVAVNLVQSSIENPLICSVNLRTIELTTSQKLTDEAVTQLLRHCPNLEFLDVGHCCQLHDPKFVHEKLETILLSFCVNLLERAVVNLFANCPSLKYVEIAVCMFDMTRFQRESKPGCRVVVNFDF